MGQKVNTNSFKRLHFVKINEFLNKSNHGILQYQIIIVYNFINKNFNKFGIFFNKPYIIRNTFGIFLNCFLFKSLFYSKYFIISNLFFFFLVRKHIEIYVLDRAPFIISFKSFPKINIKNDRQSKNNMLQLDFNNLSLFSIKAPISKIVSDFISYIFIQEQFKLINFSKFCQTFKQNFDKKYKFNIKNKVFILKGLRFDLKGRFSGSDRSKKLQYKVGAIPFQSLSGFISYSCTSCVSVYGTFSIKVWLFFNNSL